MDPNQTAPIWSGPIMFAIKTSKLNKQMREQTTIVMDGRKGLPY